MHRCTAARTAAPAALHARALPAENEQSVANETRPWVSFFRPNLTIALVDHFASYPKNGIPPQVGAARSVSRCAALRAALRPALRRCRFEDFEK